MTGFNLSSPFKMSGSSMKYILIFIVFFTSINLFAQVEKASSDKNIENDGSDYPFLGIEYVLYSSQTPGSDEYNLAGLSSVFSYFEAEMNYAWYLDKKRENTVLLSSLGYSFFKTDLNLKKNRSEEIKNEAQEYIYNIPNIHDLYFGLLINQKLGNHWELTGTIDITLASDLKHSIDKKDVNTNMLLYAQKKLGDYYIGIGGFGYILGNKLKGIPISYASYQKRKSKLEILLPVSLQYSYRANEKTTYRLFGDLDFGGYRINQNSTSKSLPDYAETTALQIRLCYDREFADKLHWDLGLGYYYRQLSFVKNSKSIDKLTFSESLFISARIYCGF